MKTVYVLECFNPEGDHFLMTCFESFDEARNFVEKSHMFWFDKHKNSNWQFTISELGMFSSYHPEHKLYDINFVLEKLGYDKISLEDL